jgi:Tol biopolymer transport system component
MKQKLFVFIVFILILAFASSASLQQSAEQLYQSGIYKEEVEGQLEKAIEIYQTIVKQFPGNREIAAKAQLHIGLCYEKLGFKEAEKAFQKVVENYPEQAEAVKVAKEKLSLILKAQAMVEKGDKEFKIKQVWTGPDVDINGKISPNGKYLSYVDWSTGDLAVLEIETGKKRRLTNKGPWTKSSDFALFSTWSPDSVQVAYEWITQNITDLRNVGRFTGGGFIDLRIIGLDGSKHRVLFQDENIVYLHPIDWSSDGKYILTGFSRKDQTNHIGLISIADGSLRVIKSFGKLGPSKINFSPDGHYVVYSLPPQEGAAQNDIYLLSVDGSYETPLIKHPADDLLVGWAPDGKNILFISDRSGSLDLWAVRVAEGKLMGEPELIKKDTGRLWPMGFTNESSLFYWVDTSMEDVYIATLDLEKGKSTAPPTRASQRFMGSNNYPDWSPDGKYLAFVSVRLPGPDRIGSRVLCILSLETGKQRELSLQLKSLGRLRWSPDGRSILFSGTDIKDRAGLYTVNPQTGETTLLWQREPETRILGIEWAPDGKEIFFAHIDWPKKISHILRYDLATRQQKEIYRQNVPTILRIFALSPDGKQLAFEESNCLRVIAADGGEARDLLKVQPQEGLSSLAWTIDGKEIIFSKALSPAKLQEQTRELWRIPADGGEPQKLGLAMDRIEDLRVHPDGQRLAFSSQTWSTEIWVMENFLKKAKESK